MEQLHPTDGFAALATGIDERPARAAMRRQIATLERELAQMVGEGFGRVEVEHRLAARPAGPRAPRPLDLGELELLRDALAARIGVARRALRERAREEAAKCELLRAMLARPAEHRWVLVTRAEVGEPGCGGWHSRPRLGFVGMLMGWWRVKVSSGCPLAGRLAAVER